MKEEIQVATDLLKSHSCPVKNDKIILDFFRFPRTHPKATGKQKPDMPTPSLIKLTNLKLRVISKTKGCLKSVIGNRDVGRYQVLPAAADLRTSCRIIIFAVAPPKEKNNRHSFATVGIECRSQ